MLLNPWRGINEIDRALDSERASLESLIKSGAIEIPIMDTDGVGGHSQVPEAFSQTQSITTPALATRDNVVLTFNFEPGYMGILTHLRHIYVGSGFIEGSSSIVWHWLVALRFIPNYSNILVQWGDAQLGRKVIRGIPVFPGDNIQCRADVNNTVTVGGQTRLIAEAAGVKFPVR